MDSGNCQYQWSKRPLMRYCAIIRKGICTHDILSYAWVTLYIASPIKLVPCVSATLIDCLFIFLYEHYRFIFVPARKAMMRVGFEVQHIQQITQMVVLLCFVLLGLCNGWYCYVVIDLSIFFGVTSLLLWRLYDYPNAHEHWGNHTITAAPEKQLWRIWVNQPVSNHNNT